MDDACEIFCVGPSFAEGVACLLDFGNTLTEDKMTKDNTSSDLGQTDFLALRADWRAVAHDFRSAMSVADAELQPQQP